MLTVSKGLRIREEAGGVGDRWDELELKHTAREEKVHGEKCNISNDITTLGFDLYLITRPGDRTTTCAHMRPDTSQSREY